MHLSAVLEKGLAKKEDDITNVASTAAKKNHNTMHKTVYCVGKE